MLQTEMETTSDVVKEGTVCGYSTQGKDACQVSSWALVCLAILLSPHNFLIHRPLHSPLMHVKGTQGDKLPRLGRAGLPASFSRRTWCYLEGVGRRGESQVENNRNASHVF